MTIDPTPAVQTQALAERREPPSDRLQGLQGLSAAEVEALGRLSEKDFDFLHFASGQGYEQLFYRMPSDPALKRATQREMPATAENSGCATEAALRAFAGGPSRSKVLSILASLRLLFARAVSRGHPADYFDTEEIWIGRAADTPARHWEKPVMGRSDLLGRKLPQPLIQRVYQQVRAEMHEAGLVELHDEAHAEAAQQMRG